MAVGTSSASTWRCSNDQRFWAETKGVADRCVTVEANSATWAEVRFECPM
jgi:hypothetical protein